MAQSLASLDKEVSDAASTADIAALTAQILVCLTSQLQDQNHGLPAVTEKLNTISNRGNQDKPVYLVTDSNQPLSVKIEPGTTQIFESFAQIIHDFVDLKKNVEYLMKAFDQLQEAYGKHHHHINKIDANTGHALPVFKPISFSP